MACCAILTCLNTTKKVGVRNPCITFHRFPNDPLIKNKWIEATGRKNWFPTKYNRICSAHFHEDDFTGPSKYRRLIRTAHPIIDIVKIITDVEEPSSVKDDNILGDDNTNTPRKRKLEKDINEPSASNETPNHTPKEKKILNQLNNARQMIKEKDKQIKRLKEQNRRKVKKIFTLMTLLTSLKKGSLISDEQSESLKTPNVTTYNV